MSLPRLATTSTVTAIAAAGALVLAGCGSDSLDSGGSGSAAPTTSVSNAPTPKLDSALAAKVPAAVKSKGTLTVGTDASYAPNEFVGSDGSTIQGMDIDLMNAVATTLGLKFKYVNGGFDSLILGVGSGKYDASISSFTINPERKKTVNMVSYFNAGSQWATLKGNPKKVDPANACGLTVGVQKGTVQIDDLTARSKKCTTAGKKPITQVVEEQQSKVNLDLQSGKVAAMVADSPVALYAVKQSSGKLAPVGSIYDSAPYGVVVKKDQTAFAQAIQGAMTQLKTSGAYTAVLAKWGNTSGAVDSFAVNP